MSQSDFAVPIEDRHFEDYVPGVTYEYGSVAVTEDEVIAFARRFDPQTMHTDPAAAARGAFGGLIASGWHTAAMAMHLIATRWLTTTAGLASPGVDELRWIKPVRPGDELRIRVTTVSAERSRSKPDRGLVRSFIEVLNQRDEVVMSMIGMVLIRCRTPAP
ncbi:MaoC family dehydratase [Rhodoplanes sp. TEM]|uniref:MaoC family dehydratase n=1 Tax=Rhodoplanes tepidamans TaxID=200616 RepID=A0ABT5JKL0_RHOTP|nr:MULTISPECIES: MaoC family dehydratase [Rhodoplanes]MDC7789814.1 MaoC family dehydratase [Rhodoplanes tepidamans]MDC7987477.1 MaoC family dehydratase [Rhodoplanes sp. TEM]MDQ0359226.1 acyl dehydratase [Rhodoplanes tepidamans]